MWSGTNQKRGSQGRRQVSSILTMLYILVMKWSLHNCDYSCANKNLTLCSVHCSWTIITSLVSWAVITDVHNVLNAPLISKCVVYTLYYCVVLVFLMHSIHKHTNHSLMWRNCLQCSCTVVSCKYNPPFATLALVQSAEGGLYAGCDIFSRDYALPSGAPPT